MRRQKRGHALHWRVWLALGFGAVASGGYLWQAVGRGDYLEAVLAAGVCRACLLIMARSIDD